MEYLQFKPSPFKCIKTQNSPTIKLNTFMIKYFTLPDH